MKEVLEAALRAEQTGEPAALVTVVSTEGSTPQKAGAKMVVYPDGRIVGTIGGGCVEAEMTWRARQVIDTHRSQLASYDLTADQAGEDGLVCGGRMQVFIEPIEGTPTLCLFGAGHVAQPLARMAKMAGFRVEVADDRAKFANRDRFPDADLVIVDDFAAAAEKMTIGPNTYAVVVTRGHKGDAETLQAVVGRGLRFVGLLGSVPKMVHIFSGLEEKGVPPEKLAEVHTPVGLEIGALTPEEIAVSILAEMIAVRRGVDSAAIRPMKKALPGRLKVGR
ncbi:MAG TPA: XdhC/CoxI family protein [Vicinamibacteria bacterium]|jgi:xanthine dehydrogenase accessory factor|nr:XdhC/CoxI family protein [Vicinamibacteria bacterium]